MDIFRVAFIGHRKISNVFEIERTLDRYIGELLKSTEYVEFYMGRNGDFDIYAASAVKRAQKKYGSENSSLILVLPYASKNDKYYTTFYDEILYPVDPATHFKAAIGKRNKWMVNHCHELIAYVEQSRGGAYQTYSYARKQGKHTFNFADVKERDLVNVSLENLLRICFLKCLDKSKDMPLQEKIHLGYRMIDTEIEKPVEENCFELVYECSEYISKWNEQAGRKSYTKEELEAGLTAIKKRTANGTLYHFPYEDELSYFYKKK